MGSRREIVVEGKELEEEERGGSTAYTFHIREPIRAAAHRRLGRLVMYLFQTISSLEYDWWQEDKEEHLWVKHQLQGREDASALHVA